ncbi:MAG: hypothetical protein WBP45_12805 [Daejeonella sp.]
MSCPVFSPGEPGFYFSGTVRHIGAAFPPLLPAFTPAWQHFNGINAAGRLIITLKRHIYSTIRLRSAAISNTRPPIRGRSGTH